MAQRLRRTVEQVLRALIGDRRVAAVVDFPNYPNVGDSAIYLGQLDCLRALGVPRPRFICDFTTYTRRGMARATGDDGIILLTGGGSFGDIWPIAQECREDILHAFPDNPVIQLPQTVHFEQRAALDRARRAASGHRNLTLLLRDERSLEIARREFDVPCQPCPDMAFCLEPLQRPSAATRPIVWLSRSDKEGVAAPPPEASAFVTDWLEEAATPLLRVNYSLMGATMRLRPHSFWRGLLMRTYTPLATQRLHRGLAVLGAGQVVITDRLHGHILALLLGIPHVLLDDRFRKLSSFHQSWTRDVDGVHFAGSPREALALARRLAEEPDTPNAGIGRG